VASVIQSIGTLKELSPDTWESNIPMTQSLHYSISENARLSGAEVPMTYDELSMLHFNAIGKEETLQSTLLELQTPHTVNCFINSINDSKRLAWYTSSCGEDSTNLPFSF
jgi:hypothetical protein